MKMPELPEVETMVRGIRPDCIDRRIDRTIFPKCICRPIQISPSRRVFTARTENKTILSIVRLAKRIVLGLDSGDRIVIEPRMTGLMLLTDPPTQKHRRLCFELSPVKKKARSLEFWDRRGLGTVSLLKPKEFAELESRLGRDALDIPNSDWIAILSNTNREIKVALLDQTLVAGIGNLYASEILHEAGVSPFRPASKLSQRQIEKLMLATNRILHQAIAYEGSTLGDGTYRNALNKDGGYQNQHQVYDREGECCPLCKKASIKRIVQAQRSTFYCARCQR
jgi:formamidopyrimidine-DNA glycosylase